MAPASTPSTKTRRKQASSASCPLCNAPMIFLLLDLDCGLYSCKKCLYPMDNEEEDINRFIVPHLKGEPQSPCPQPFVSLVHSSIDETPALHAFPMAVDVSFDSIQAQEFSLGVDESQSLSSSVNASLSLFNSYEPTASSSFMSTANVPSLIQVDWSFMEGV